MDTHKSVNKFHLVDLQRISLWVGATVLVVDSICLIAIGEFEFIIATGMLLGLSLISLNLWPYIGMKQPARDERAAHIGARVGLASWYISLISTVITAIVLGYLPEFLNIHPTLAQGFGIVIIVMVVTMVLLYEYMIRKGEVE